MKRNAVIFVLILAALGLGVSLAKLKQKAADDQKTAESRIIVYSNQVNQYVKDLDEQRTVNLTLETNLAVTKAEYSNKLIAAEANLANTASALTKAQAEAKAAADAAAAEIALRDKRIGELELQNHSLDQQALELRLSITNLESQIVATQKKLDSSEGDRKFLLKELERLRIEKADLEKKFNDLDVLRAQVRKLKEELVVSRRLDWIRRGVYSSLGEKGAERLMRPATVAPTATNQHDLNIELKQDGTSKIEPVSAPVSK